MMTKREQQCLKVFAELKERNDRRGIQQSPAQKDVAAKMKADRSFVASLMKSLREKGYLKNDPSRKWSYELVA